MRLHKDGSPILFCTRLEYASFNHRTVVAYITSEAFWQKCGHLDDCIRCPEDLKGWFDLQEATMESKFVNLDEAKDDLIKNGLKFSTELQNFMGEED